KNELQMKIDRADGSDRAEASNQDEPEGTASEQLREGMRFESRFGGWGAVAVGELSKVGGTVAQNEDGDRPTEADQRCENQQSRSKPVILGERLQIGRAACRG